MIEISPHILDEARTILSREDVELPAQIKSGPAFYVAEGTDDTILAFGAIEHNGKVFKIGSMRSTDS